MIDRPQGPGMHPAARIALAITASILAVAAMAAFGSAASAQNGDENGGDNHDGMEVPPLAIVNAVDASTSPIEVSILADDYGIATSDVTLTEAGVAVEEVSVTTARELGRPAEVIFVLDVANRTVADGALSAMAGAIMDSVSELPPDVRFGLVTAGERANLRTRLTTDRSRLRSDLLALVAGRGASLYDAAAIAGDTFSETRGAARTIVLLSSGPDTASTRTAAAVESTLVQSGAQLIWIPRGTGDEGLASLVEHTGGTTVPLADMSEVGSVVSTATTMAADRLLVTFPGSTEAGRRGDVSLTVGASVLHFSYPAGLNTTSQLQLAPRTVMESGDLGLFGQPAALYVSIVLAFAAISTGLWALGSMFAGGDTSLDKVLARYSDKDETLEDDEVQEMLVQTALVRRAIDMTETFAESRGFLSRIEDLLERANLPVRAGEAVFFLAALMVVAGGLMAAVIGSLLVGIVVGLIAAIGGFIAVQFIASRRLKKFESQLPDALQLLAGTLRAGYSLPQGLDAVSTEISDPMGHELRRAITETQLGREIEDALAGIAERLDSEDFAWAVMAIGIQREVGGNLSEVLLTVSDTMIQRERLHREVNALTAEGRVSAGILSMLPPGLGLVMWVMNPDYLGVLFSRRIGWILLSLAVVAGLVGLAWMKKVVTIDV